MPQVLREVVLTELHKAHAGINATKSLARTYVYWPGIDNDITLKIKSCSDCMRIENAPTKHELHSWPRCTAPWQRLHIDYASKNNENFLVVVDAYSKYPEIVKTSSTTSKATIEHLTDIFARFGLPITAVTDNGPQFKSEEFEEFMANAEIEHLTISPYHPNSNGQAERFVQTLKRALEKMSHLPSKMALNRFLSYYRMTPNPNCPDNASPAEVLLGRKVRTIFDKLLPPPEIPRDPNTEMEDAYNKKHGAKNRSFIAQQSVRFRAQHKRGNEWTLGTIIEAVGNSMYNVLLNTGRLIRAHADQLLPAIPSESTSIIPQDYLASQFLLEECGLSPENEDLNISSNSFHSLDLDDHSFNHRASAPVFLDHRRSSHSSIINVTLHDDSINELLREMTQTEREDFLDSIYKDLEDVQ